MKMNIQFEEERAVTPIWGDGFIKELVPGPTRSYLRLGPFRVRVPSWFLWWFLELAN